jgi:solute carrier family 35 (UDP-galactose transporter), member B1
MALAWQLKLLFLAAGVYSTFLVYGILVEQLERARFDKEPFHHWLFVTLVSAIVNVMVAYACLRIGGRAHKEALNTPHSMISFSWIALAQSVASASALAALDYVDFPTQTLGKCAKPISILVTGLFFFSKRGSSHGWKKTFTTVLVCAGISVFFLGKPGTADSTPISLFGVGLILLSLICDGFVGGLQASMKTAGGGHSTSPYQMMLYINFWSVWIILSALVVRSQLAAPILFLIKYPSALMLLLGLNVSMACGQIFIYALISSFDPLVCSLTTTTRKFFSILASVVIYRIPVTTMQWVGVALVFAGLLLPELQTLLVTEKEKSK